MGKLFAAIYDFFARHKPLYWILLVFSTLALAWGASRLTYYEDITDFFPEGKKQLTGVFENMKSKDRISVLFVFDSSACGGKEAGAEERLIEAAESFGERAARDAFFSSHACWSARIDVSEADTLMEFIYGNLPVFLSDSAFSRLDSLLQPGFMERALQENYRWLFSPMGAFLAETLYRDPFGFGHEALANLQALSGGFDYLLQDGYIFSKDGNCLLSYIDPGVDANSPEAKGLVSRIREFSEQVEQQCPGVEVQAYGALLVAAGNSERVKKDTLLTVGVALLLVIALIAFSFRNKWSLLWVLAPVLYGGLAAMASMYVLKGDISLIAMGSGAVVLGIALSYSMHVLSHTNHCHDMREVVRELSAPLTIGSFTTIGAFAGLTFTTSSLLQDFGLFAAFALIGTTLFSLVFLPHLIAKGKPAEANALLRAVERISSAGLDRKPFLIGLIGAVSIVCLFFFQKVGFDSDMMKLNYQSPELDAAQERLESFQGEQERYEGVFVAVSDSSGSGAAARYQQLCRVLDSLAARSEIGRYSSVSAFVLPETVQQERIERWNAFWTEARTEELLARLEESAGKTGFEPGAFSAFGDLVKKAYEPVRYDASGEGSFARAFPDWISFSGSGISFLTNVRLEEDSKPAVYESLSGCPGVMALDRAFFAGMMAEDVNYNFNLILAISGILVFAALLLSYGRMELVLMLCLPMFLTWVVILGAMAVFGIEFNIVTIILSTFIFGIGDDFSIFVMDGLLGKYKDGSDVLSAHKTAIFFSAFTMIAGMGSLVFARHPAMHSLGLISLLGIVVVVLMVYTVLPVVFRFFIGTPAGKGGFPWTLAGLLNSLYAFGLFGIGCLVIQTGMLLVLPLPVKGEKRRQWIQSLTSWSTRVFMKAMVSGRQITLNPSGEDFRRPAMVIANHQSFIDILILMGMHRKFVMMTNSWVWKSPFFGRIIRYLGFLYAKDGPENMVREAEEKVKQGYSILVFPEGTRSKDGRIGRFHKGAFYLARELRLDLVPIVLYGNGLISSKQQPFYIKKGLMVSKILPRIPYGSGMYGESCAEQARALARYFRDEYARLYETYNRPVNFHFKDALLKNYIYKGPVLEWYMRVKCRLENAYAAYDRILPREGVLVDLGCGYGAVSYMLGMLSDRRRILAFDYDAEKIALARNCYARSPRISFQCADIRACSLPEADAFLLSDVLHYLSKADQERILGECLRKVRKGGCVLVREGDSSEKRKHERTKWTETWSTRILRFNKTDGELVFLSQDELCAMARVQGFSLSVEKAGRKTSNTLFLLKKEE